MIETLFYSCYYSYLHGNLNDTRMYYDFLKEEFKKSGSSRSLSKTQLEQLKEIRQALSSGTINPKEWVKEVQNAAPSGDDVSTKSIKEVEVTRKVHFDALSDLRSLIGGSDDFHLFNLEHPCDPYGRVDMLYHDKDTAYPVEVKRGEGTHALIGQIMKYELAIRLKLHYKLYSKVQPVTICASYDGFVLSELRKIKVKPLLYKIKNDLLSLHPA